ncbi:MAG: 50S ribosomal protein L4 [Negativicoccus massiliensis]|uniref:50S ribosomal protein L4 n=1 Tax=Negativicoccus succinicivorans TaxID=620903 RepID=UPI0026F17E89|nr:50S ribosomal protein L4 [Negativicoccus succinicivorans]MBS5888045.1 50S ribosomal protein L4 [Negativicoccus succinicivorans]MDU4642348.1 50S ribosomal protein L4 [Negativicoccus massiliensis]MDU5027979.1 50S ribosomal protein L4 [Negativicoccus succinicivorans]
MPKVTLYEMTGAKAGEIELQDSVFAVDYNEAVIHAAIVRQQANERLGTHATKTRGMVRGGGKKPWRQKGTGRARVGSIRSPLWVGGGTIFGPQPRSYVKAMPRKQRRLAIKSALSHKVANDDVFVINEIELAQPKTKEVLNLLNNFEIGNDKALIITEGDAILERCARNIQGVKAMPVTALNIYDIVHYTKLFITEGAVKQLEEVLA